DHSTDPLGAVGAVAAEGTMLLLTALQLAASIWFVPHLAGSFRHVLFLRCSSRIPQKPWTALSSPTRCPLLCWKAVRPRMRKMGKRSGRPSTKTTEFMAADKIAAAKSRVDEAVRHIARLLGRQMAREAFERERGKPSRPIKPIASRSTLSSRD